MLPLELAGKSDARGTAAPVLQQVGLGPRLGHYRASFRARAAARRHRRAFVTRPAVLFADEPTGASTRRPGTA
jgi:putative ABC transport system ATP-binding protein